MKRLTNHAGRADVAASRHWSLGACHARRAFTLLEVMIATGIFFMAMFAILDLVSGTLRNARGLQKADVDANVLAAYLSLTNKLSAETASGDFQDFFGDSYRGYTWQRESYLWPPVNTNGLFQVNFAVSHHVGNKSVETYMSILLFKPLSPKR